MDFCKVSSFVMMIVMITGCLATESKLNEDDLQQFIRKHNIEYDKIIRKADTYYIFLDHEDEYEIYVLKGKNVKGTYIYGHSTSSKSNNQLIFLGDAEEGAVGLVIHDLDLQSSASKVEVIREDQRKSFTLSDQERFYVLEAPFLTEVYDYTLRFYDDVNKIIYEYY